MLLTTGRTPHYPLASGGVWGRGAAAEGARPKEGVKYRFGRGLGGLRRNDIACTSFRGGPRRRF